MPLVLSLALAVSPALGADCDVESLTTALDEASPTQVAAAYTALASCDAEAGSAATEAAFGRMLAGEDAYRATESAVGLGHGATVRTWLGSLEPDFRSSAIAHLGTACKEDPAVADFFLQVHGDLGEKFFEERWQRGLADCRTEGIQALLTDQVTALSAGGKVADTTGFFAVLEIYARNLAMDAVPVLAQLARDLAGDEEVESYVVNAFADAANVGSEMGTNPAIAAAAVKAIVDLGPTLTGRAVLQARTTLLSLGAEREADGFATHRWPERFDGSYRYAAIATELVTCKNAKQQGYFHVAPFAEGGRMWPEQIEPLLEEKLSFEWGLNAAERCKGEGTTTVVMPSEPFESDAARDAWIDEQFEVFEANTAGWSKAMRMKQDAFEM